MQQTRHHKPSVLAMKYFCGVFAVALLVGTVSAKPSQLEDFGQRVRKALKVKGINPDEVSSLDGVFTDQVGDIWSNCGKSKTFNSYSWSRAIHCDLTCNPPSL